MKTATHQPRLASFFLCSLPVLYVGVGWGAFHGVQFHISPRGSPEVFKPAGFVFFFGHCCLFVCFLTSWERILTIGMIFLCVHVFLLSAFIFILWLQGQHFLGSTAPVLNSERMGPFQQESMVLPENGGRPNILWEMARVAGAL